jgi:hypothetical protein
MADHALITRFDAGWLFLLAGLAICAAGVLIPANNDLNVTRHQLALLQRQETITNDRVAAHLDFLKDLEQGDPALVRRLAASQLNLMRNGEQAVLVASSIKEPITQWIDSTVPVRPMPLADQARSALSRLSTGPHRLWFLASGVLCVFIGLLLDHSLPTLSQQARQAPRARAGRRLTRPPVVIRRMLPAGNETRMLPAGKSEPFPQIEVPCRRAPADPESRSPRLRAELKSS